MYRRITIVGLGLIGGSLGQALRQRFPKVRITGVDREGTLTEAFRRGAIHRGAESLDEGIREAELIILCRTVPGILEDIGRLADGLRRPATVTDVGSTKGEICRRAWGIPGRRWGFIGGHPMTGSETRGVAHARAGLFRDRPYLLCPEPGGSQGGLPRLEGLLTGLGSRVVLLSPAEHDRLVAALSHLPQLAALGLSRVLMERLREHPGLPGLAGPAIREMLRVAGSDFGLWKGICSTNREQIRAAIRELLVHLRRISHTLEDASLEEYFRAGNRLRAVWDGEVPGPGKVGGTG